MVGPIQHDLGIDDKQMSLLMGFSFAVFYTLFGIPLGRLADTRSRRVIISVGIAVWSVMTAGCGLARTFWQLAVMRMGVGVGEASLSPSAYSLISDYFRPERRSTAMSVYSMGIYIGSGLAFILGGFDHRVRVSGQESTVLPWVGPVRSWQLVFLVVGLPGLAGIASAAHRSRAGRKGVRLNTDGSAITAADVAARSGHYIRDELRDIPVPHPGHGLGRAVRLWRVQRLDTGHVHPAIWLDAGAYGPGFRDDRRRARHAGHRLGRAVWPTGCVSEATPTPNLRVALLGDDRRAAFCLAFSARPPRPSGRPRSWCRPCFS